MSCSEYMEKDHLWYPYTQMKVAAPPIPVTHASGTWLYTENGRKILDAISSWWVTLHGHANKEIADAIAEQAKKMEQVIFAGFVHEPALELASRLLPLIPGVMNRLFYSDNGSTAVEVAVKMALQYWQNTGLPKTKIIALEGAYHGDTFGSMSVSGRGAFTKPFSDLLFDVIHIPFPYREKEQECVDSLEKCLDDDIAAFIFEPLIQGASGMRTYRPELLDALIDLCRQKDVLVIADEVMTGFGRTGTRFAMEHCLNNADIYCLSKGITGGFMALGATACTQKVFEAFYSDDRMKTFFHGHSYTANPIACAAAVASLKILLRKETEKKIHDIEADHKDFIQSMNKVPGVRKARSIGTIAAIELETGKDSSYFDDIGKQAVSYFLDRDILLRPLGNVIYTIPPYCISKEERNTVYDVIDSFINRV